MKILWLDINSSYAHSSLALPAMHSQLTEDTDRQIEWKVISSTISGNEDTIIGSIIDFEPDIIFSTIWIFNNIFTCRILSKASKLGKWQIILGGPEFLGDNENFLRNNPHINYVFRGDGESIFPLIIENLLKGDEEAETKIEGICYIDKKGKYIDRGKAIIHNFSQFKYPEQSRFFNWEKPFVQLETSRGCFNRCSFCISGIDNGVEYLPKEVTEKRIENIISNGIKQIRILDRTFNANEKHAADLLDLFKNYSGKVLFHIEIHPALLGNIIKERLRTIDRNLLHIEAGIQSLNDQVILNCKRSGSNKVAAEGLKFLSGYCNFDVHADLIAGLPGYSYEETIKDICKLAECNVAEIQLELLKLLPGTELRENADHYKIKYSDFPPYEVLSTENIGFYELIKIKTISSVLDNFYNNSKSRNLFKKILSEEWLFPDKFATYLMKNKINLNLLNKINKIVTFGKYIKEEHPEFFGVFVCMCADEQIPMKKEYGIELSEWLPGAPSLKENPFVSVEPAKKYEKYYWLDSGKSTFWFAFNQKVSKITPIKIIEKQ